MKTIKTPLIALFIYAIFSIHVSAQCNKNYEYNFKATIDKSINNSWSVPSDDVLDGGPGKDGIPSIDNPKFESVNKADDWLSNGDRIIGIKYNGEVKAYPIGILDWHEIVNDNVGGKPIAMTYCPLTLTGIAWDREVNGTVTEFGVSGLLYNTNLVPYDRKTNTNYSQMFMHGINGKKINDMVKTYTAIETNWGNWKKLHPDSKILSRNTGFNRSYGSSPYGSDYDDPTNSYLLFPVDNEDNRRDFKERVHGVVIDGEAKAYTFDHFQDSVNVVHDCFKETPLVVLGSKKYGVIMSYIRVLPDGTMLNFKPVQGEMPVAMKDQYGNKWDIWGNCVEGPKKGQSLTDTRSLLGAWFCWGAFYDGLPIYGENNEPQKNLPPVINKQTITFQSETSKELGDLIASDPDSDQSLTFSITGGSEKDYFTIDASSGLIKLKDSKSRDSLPDTSSITVKVEDDSSYSSQDTVLIKKDFTTSIGDNQFAQSIKVYPTPATDKIFVKSAELKNKRISFNFINLQGESVYKNYINNSKTKTEIPVQHLSKGIYLLKISSNERQITKKIMIR